MRFPSSNLGFPWLRICLLLGISLASAPGQRVYWQGPDTPPPAGVSFPLRLVFEQCSPSGQTAVPRVDGLNLGTPSLASQYSMVNFRIKQQATLTYPAYTEQTERLTIPGFKVSTDKGELPVMAFTLNIVGTTQGAPRHIIASSGLHPARTELWQNEVFDLEYVILVRPGVSASIDSQQGPGIEWNPPGLIMEPWTNPDHAEVEIDGETWTGLKYRTRAYAKQSGTLSLPKAKQKLILEQPEESMGFFARTLRQKRTIESENPPTLTVKPLPANAPPTFTGAVGKFTLDSQFVPQEASVGEPITWTLKLAGTGNWPVGWKLPARTTPPGFRIIQPRENRSIPEDKLFDGTLNEDLILVPSTPGTAPTLPASFTFFDTETGTYQTLESPQVHLKINPSKTLPPTASDRDQTTAPNTPTAPVLPLLRDPLPDQPAGTPPHFPPWIGLLLSALVLAGSWAGLAIRETFAQDPLRPRRRARQRLEHWAASLPAPTTAATLPRPCLIEWRHLTTELFACPIPEPSAPYLSSLIAQEHGTALSAQWSKLWDEAEAALFGADAKLARDWPEHAVAALHQLPRPRIPFIAFCKFRSWWPAAVSAFLLLLCPAASGTAAEPPSPQAAYQNGDFAQASKLWTAEIQEHPTQWATRHNLALALWQSGDRERALAHWVAARALAPRADSLRWNLRLAENSLQLPSSVTPSTPLRWFFYVSAAEWQWGLWSTFALIAAGASLHLVIRYRHLPRSFRPLSHSLTLCGITFAALCSFGLHAQGPLADLRAVVVAAPADLRSIPSEAEAQATRIPPGTVAVAESTFLGWTRLHFHDGNQGWTRSSNLIHIYSSPLPQP